MSHLLRLFLRLRPGSLSSGRGLLAFGLVLLVFGLGIFQTSDIYAAPGAIGFSITVNTTTDEYDAVANANCSLREAITTANTDVNFGGCTRVSSGSPPDDIILQASATYTLTRTGSDDTNINGDLDITETVTIQGNNATVNGNGTTTSDRVIDILSGSGVVNISGVTIKNGKQGGVGGGIRNAATLHLSNCTITNNQTLGNAGAGIYNDDVSPLTMDNCIVSNNASGTLGGGISNSGIMVISNSTISTNTADSRGGAIVNLSNLTVATTTISGNSAGTRGGGIYNSNKMTVTNSTIRQNDSPDGGGIYNENAMTITGSSILSNTASTAGGMRISGGLAIANVVNSTISGNSATSTAGGIFVDNFGVLYLRSATIANNSSDSDSTSGGNGGGLNGGELSGNATVNLRNTIIAGNFSNGGSGPDCFGLINMMNYSLIGNTSSCNVGAVTGNLLDVSPSLISLANNGGPTLTHAFPTSSPVFNAADPAGCTDQAGTLLNTDQRGFLRHVIRCDMGALELPPPFSIYLPLVLR